LLFSEAEINKNAPPLGVIVEEIGWLDVTV
jgi:hypothetical protein